MLVVVQLSTVFEKSGSIELAEKDSWYDIIRREDWSSVGMSWVPSRVNNGCKNHSYATEAWWAHNVKTLILKVNLKRWTQEDLAKGHYYLMGIGLMKK